MPNGTYSLKQILHFTQQGSLPNPGSGRPIALSNRFEYRKRDVVKRIIVKEVREVNRHDIPGEPRVRIKYMIQSKSWPQYYPYYTKKDSRGRERRYQRTTSHSYDLTLELPCLSINTVLWKGRVGSGKKWNTKPPQQHIKTIYPNNKRRWTSNRIASHKRKAKYLDAGDYNSQALGLNGDFIFRCSFAWWMHGHLFGRNYYGNIPASITNPKNVVFAPKHFLNMVDFLLQKGLLIDE